MHKQFITALALTSLALGAGALTTARAGTSTPPPVSHTAPQAQKSVTHGHVTVEGQRINYNATAGTIILKNQDGKPTGSMFYVAYTKRGVKDESKRPITFFYNGGPGSSTMWLHMGAFGPQRIQTADHTHTPPAPYKLVNNKYSLLDVTDEVFIDAMSTGYSRILGKDRGGVGKPEDFYGVDPDVKAFARFITRYMTLNSRWNSPKYLYGESYGTLRSELLADYLERHDSVGLNGIVLQSAYMGSAIGWGSDAEYATILPTMTAEAWYHHKLPNQPDKLEPLLKKVEHFALTKFSLALNQGNSLDQTTFNSIAKKLHDYTGLDTDYIKKANLRVSPGEFFHELLNKQGLTLGRLDGRFVGPSMDPLSKTSEYDPQSAAISSAYVAGFNHYVHNVLKYGRNQTYRPVAYSIIKKWPRKDSLGGHHVPLVNGGIELAQVMKYDPDLKVLVSSGYYDFATPFFSMDYEINHLRIPQKLQSNIQVDYYQSGHMIYVHIPGLKKLHDNTAKFIDNTDNL
jgi:carboxypeptidase C (cathepsin A)